MQIAKCKMQSEDTQTSIADDLRERTKQYALRIIRLYSSLRKAPDNGVLSVLGKQFLRSGTSVGAHYSEACRARSRAEFLSKMEGGLQELEETRYLLELLVESQSVDQARLKPLQEETRELVAIFVASTKTAKANRL